MVWPEVEAKLAERPYPGLPRNRGLDPHHLTTARRTLLQDGDLEVRTEATRGGRRISVLVPKDRRGRDTAVDRAASRKRLLQARYLSWTQAAAPPRPNMIGDAGERVVHASLRAAAADPAVGYRLARPEGGSHQKGPESPSYTRIYRAIAGLSAAGRSRPLPCSTTTAREPPGS